MGVLADKIRAKYPGAYQGVADDQLEAAVVAKYPQYARVSEPAPAEPSLLQSAMAGPGQAVDRLLGAVVPGEAGKRLAGNEATAGQELAKAFVPGYEAPVTPTEIAAGIVQPHVGAAMALGGLGHGRALQKATVEFAGDALRDPYTWGALGALKRLGLVGKGLTAGANAIFALKAGEAVPGEFAEAKRLYDEKGFTPEVTEAIAKGVLLGGAAAMGARGTLKEGAQFGREATAAGGRAVRGVAEKANRIPGEALEGLGTSAGAGIGASIAGGPGAMVGQLLGKQGGAVIKALLQRLAAEKAGVPTEVVDVPAPKPDLAPGETLRPVPPAAQRPARVPEFSPEAMGLELLPEDVSAAPPAAPRPAPPVEAPAPRTMAEVLVARTPEGVGGKGPSIGDVLDATRLAEPVEFPGMTPEDAATQAAAQEASVARVKAKDLMARAFEAQLKAQEPGAKPATVKAAERAQQKALEARTLAETLLARFDEGGDWNPEYPQWSPAMPAEARWANQPPNPALVGITPPRGGHVPVGAEVYPRGRLNAAAVAAPPVEAPQPPPAAPPVEAPALLPEGQRAMPGGRSGEAQAPPAEFRGLDTPEKQAAFAQLQRLLAGEPVEAAPAKAPTSVEAELMRLLSELPPPPEGSPTVIRASKRKRVSK